MNVMSFIVFTNTPQLSKSYMYDRFLLFTATHLFACVHGRYDTINSYLTQIFMCATVNVKTMLLDLFYLRVNNYQLSSFATCSYVLVYVRSVSLYTTLLPKFCQATEAKIFVHIGFVNSCKTVTANGNIFN